MTGNREGAPEGKKPAPPAAPPPTCKVCGDPLVENVVLCRACRSPHHEVCWRYNRGCALFGCGSNTYVRGDEAPRDVPEDDAPLEVPLSGAWEEIAGIVFAVLLLCLPLPVFGFFGVGPGVAATVVAMAGALAGFTCRVTLVFDPARGVVERRIRLPGPLTLPLTYVVARASAIVEVHVHQVTGSFGAPLQVVYLALEDGTRLEVTTWGALDFRRVDRLAEWMARFADTTVRFFEGPEGPSAEEIRGAAASRRLAVGPEGEAPALEAPEDADRGGPP